MKKNSFFLISLIVVLLIFAVIISCENLVNDDSNLFKTYTEGYETTIHEYVLYEYFSRYDSSHYVDILLENSHSFIKDNEIEYYLLSEFIIENLHLFTDAKLFEEIISESKNKFNIDENTFIENMFSDSVKTKYLDYKNEHGGRNLMVFTIDENMDMLWENYDKNIKNLLTAAEQVHFETFLELSFQAESFIPMISFLEESIDNESFTDMYNQVLKFTLNTSRFYDTVGFLGSDDIDVDITIIPFTIVRLFLGNINDTQAFILQYAWDTNFCFECTWGSPMAFMTHEQHMQDAAIEALIASGLSYLINGGLLGAIAIILYLHLFG